MSGERVLGADGGRVAMTTVDGGQGIADGSTACCPACVDYIDIGFVTLPGRRRLANVIDIEDENVPPPYLQVIRYSGDADSSHWLVEASPFPVQPLGGKRRFRLNRGAPPHLPPIQLPQGQSWGEDSAYAWEEFDIGVLPKLWQRFDVLDCNGNAGCLTPPLPPFDFYYCFVATLCYHEWPPCNNFPADWAIGTWDDARWHAPWAVAYNGPPSYSLHEWLTHVQWIGKVRVYFGRVQFGAEETWDAEHLFRLPPNFDPRPPLYCWAVFDVPDQSFATTGEIGSIHAALLDCPSGVFVCAPHRFDHLPTETTAGVGYGQVVYIDSEPLFINGDGIGGVIGNYYPSAGASPQASTHETWVYSQTGCVCDDDDDGPPTPDPDPEIPPGPGAPQPPAPGDQPPDPCDELVGGARCECYRRRARCANPPGCGGPGQPRCCRPDIVPPECIPGQEIAYRGTGECETVVTQADYYPMPACGMTVRDRIQR